MRNFFTLLFRVDRIGKRKTKTRSMWGNWKKIKKRTKMQRTRRAHQGKKNEIYGRFFALKARREFGRRKSVPQFRR